MTPAPTSTLSAAAIEAIVREVLARLDREAVLAQAATSSPAAGSAAVGSAAVGPAGARAATLALADAVISARMLEGRLANVRELQVATRAIVTPAARDLLARQRVHLVRSAQPGKDNCLAPAASRERALVLGCTDSPLEAEPLVRVLAPLGIIPELLPAGALVATVDGLAQHVQRGSRAVLLTRRTAAAVCLANRQPGVRAAQIRRVEELTAALADVELNVLVIQPGELTLFGTRQLIRQFVAAQPAAPCAELAKRLSHLGVK